MLDIYGRNPEVFVANKASSLEMVVFALIAALAVPVVFTLVLGLASSLSESAYEACFYVIVGLLSLAAGLVVSRQIVPDGDVVALVLAAAVAGVVWFLARRVDYLFVWAAAALPVLLLVFLTVSDTSRLIWVDPEPPPGAVAIEAPASIVFVQLDELPLASLMEPSGSINDSLFPNFARLADEGTWYRNALSDSIATTQSVPSILTGTRVERGLSPTAADHPNNLFTLLADSHEMHVIEWVAALCVEDICPDYAGRAPARFTSLVTDLFVVYGHLTLPPSAREGLPSIDNAWKGFLGQASTPTGTSVEIDGVPVPPPPKRVEWADWVERIANGLDNNMGITLSYAHLEAPHVPWVTNPSGTHYDRPEDYNEVEGVEGGYWTLDPRQSLLAYQRHVYQLGFLDKMLGRLLERLDETGQWDDTMVIVLADHGASFVPGEHRRWPRDNNRDDLYRVPLLIKYPGQDRGAVVDEPAFGHDVLPTIVDALGIDIDWEFDGISLLDVEGTDRPHEPIRWCCSGAPASTDLDVLFEQVERNHTWIPDQTSWLGVAAAGSAEGLLGMGVDGLPVAESEAFTWSLDRGADLVEADFDSGIVQTLLTGRVELPAGAGSELLLIVNETVAGVGFVVRDSANAGTLRGLLAEELIADGLNTLDVLVANPDGRGWLSGTSSVLSITYVTEDGRELDVGTEGAKRVQVDKVSATESGWELVGWAADVARKLVPDHIYVYVGAELIVSSPPNLENGNVVAWFDSDDLLESGFELVFDAEQLPIGVEQVTVVAEFDGTAVADQVRLIAR